MSAAGPLAALAAGAPLAVAGSAGLVLAILLGIAIAVPQLRTVDPTDVQRSLT